MRLKQLTQQEEDIQEELEKLVRELTDTDFVLQPAKLEEIAVLSEELEEIEMLIEETIKKEKKVNSIFKPSFGAGVLLVAKSTGRFLLAKRGNEISYPSQWTNFGGGSEPGESPEETAKRELKEESGYRGRILRLVKSLVSNNPHNKYTFHNYIALVPDEFVPPMVGRKTVDGHVEVQDHGWFSWFEITQNRFPYGQMHYGIKDLFRYNRAQILSILRNYCGNPKMPR